MLQARDVTLLRNVEPTHSYILEQTVSYFEGAADKSTLDQITVAVGRVRLPERMTWVIYGYGSSPRARYIALADRPGVDVLWSAPIVPWWLYPITMIAAAYGGLVHVREASYLRNVFLTLSELAMVEAYLVSESIVPDLVQYVRLHRWRSFIGQVAGKEPGYFCLGVDGDNTDTPTGYLGWVSYGARCPAALVESIQPFTTADST